MGAVELIKAWYDAAQDDPSLLQSLIAARTSALNGTLSKGGGNTLTQSQKNGISYSVLVSLSETERIAVLNKAISFIRAGIRPTTRTKGGFQHL